MSLDNYERKAVIGKGSYGEVWLARHKYDKKQYVLKKMDLRNASKRERLAAEQEARLLFDMKHPNIVAYRDSFEAESGFLYIVMGYCEGGDLYARLKQQKNIPLEERQIVEWFVQIAMALQYMHEKKILHRDLKTQNIFLTKSKIIKVGDLGIARVLESSSDMATTLIGTPYYMSPELFSNKPYSFKSDVWALGCCVYEMTTLKHAFNAKDMNSLMYKVLRGKMPPMPDIYRIELMNLIKAMLQTNPDKRPSVGRILRDPYIKQNIAIFLEGTKKRTQQSDTRTTSGERKSGGTAQSADSSNQSKQQPSQPARSRNGKVDESLEPLHIGPDLEPIKEEATPRDSITDASSRINSGKKSAALENSSNHLPGRQRSQSGSALPLVDSKASSAYAECSGQSLASKQSEISVAKDSAYSSKISSSSSFGDFRGSGDKNIVKDSKPAQQERYRRQSLEEQQVQQKSEQELQKMEQEQYKLEQEKINREIRLSVDSVDGAKRRERRREKIACDKSRAINKSSDKLPRALPLYESEKNKNSEERNSVENKQKYNHKSTDCTVRRINSGADISGKNDSEGRRKNEEIVVNRATSGVSYNRNGYSPDNYKGSEIINANGYQDSVEERNLRNYQNRRIYAEDKMDYDVIPVKDLNNDRPKERQSIVRTPADRPLPFPGSRPIRGSSGSRSSTDSSSRPPVEPKSGSSPASSKTSDNDQRKRSTSRKSRARNSQDDDFQAEKSRDGDSRDSSSRERDFHAEKSSDGKSRAVKSQNIEARDRLGWENVESGYASVSSSVNEDKERRGDRGWHTPRGSFDAAAPKMSTGARARRRAERESQTPRSHTSIDLPAMARDRTDSSIDERRHHAHSQSSDYANIHRSKSSDFDRLKNEEILQPRDGAGDGRINERRQTSKSRVQDDVDVDDEKGEEEEEGSNECRKSSSSSTSSVDAEDSRVREVKRNDREMKSFITLLDTTLHMQRHRSPRDEDISDQCYINNNDDNAEDDEDLEIAEEVVIRPPVSRICDLTFVRPRPSRLPAGSNYPVIGQTNDALVEPVARLDEREGRDIGSMTSTGRLWERMVILRKDCIRNIGMEKLNRAYEILDNFESEELEPRLKGLLGTNTFEAYAGKIWQLKFCEESYYTGCS